MKTLKVCFLFLKCLILLAVRLSFGNIIHDVALKHDGALSVSELRKLEKLNIKVKKAELDKII